MKYEVEIRAEAADLDVRLYFNNGVWEIEVYDTSDLPAEEKSLRGSVDTITAASLMALFIGLGEDPEANKEVVDYLYYKAEKFLTDVPQNLRMIP
jgi:hypothetical protein